VPSRGAAVGRRSPRRARPIRSAAMPKPMRPTTESSPVRPEDTRDEEAREGRGSTAKRHLVGDDREDGEAGCRGTRRRAPRTARVCSASPISVPQVSGPPALARARGAGSVRPVVDAEPDQRQQHRERAHAQDEVGDAPAVARDQPLRERPHRQHAPRPMPEKATPIALPRFFREPPRDQSARGQPSSPRPAPVAVITPTIR